MKVKFQDLEELDNPRNGEHLASASQVVGLLDDLHSSRPPFMCELIGDNGFMLTVGIASEDGCVQYSPSDGNPPYYMAVGSPQLQANMGDVEFTVGGTATPIDRRYCLPFDRVKQIASYFTQTGDRSPDVPWEEI
jgi:hypothetical protein